MSNNTPSILGERDEPPPRPTRNQHLKHHQASLTPHGHVSSAMSQQSAFQQNAQLPVMDNPALANISPAQLAEIARLFQIGALTLPPAPGGTATPAGNTNTTSQAAEGAFGQQMPTSDRTAAVASDTDKEEGEVEELGSENTHEPRTFLRPPPSGPRNGNVNLHNPMASNGGARDATVVKRQQPPLHETKMSRQHAVMKTRPVDKEYSAKAFILEMVKAGRKYDDLAPLVTSPTLLASIFQELKIPATTDSDGKLAAQHVNGPSSVHSHPAAVQKVPTEEQRKVSATKRPQPQSLDRNEYLARLQAAKTKKSDVTPVLTDEPAASTADVSPSKAEPVEAPKPKPPTTKPIDRTALVRERLEALKAAQAAKQNRPTVPTSHSNAVPAAVTRTAAIANWVSSQAGQPTQVTAVSELGTQFAGLRSQQGSTQPQTAGGSHQVPVPSDSLSSIPPPSTPTSAMGGLPGLFLGPSPGQVAKPAHISQAAPNQRYAPSATPQTPGGVLLPSATPFAISRKRPVASDFDEIPDQASTPKRPFGQSRTTSEDESLVIEVSDEEDEDNGMAVEDSDANLGAPNVPTKSFRDVGPLRDFPPKPNVQSQPSMPSTPGTTTPGGYEQKVKDIEAMRRRIAEMEAKKKALGLTGTAAAAADDTPAAMNRSTDVFATPVEASFFTPDQQYTPKIDNLPLATETEAVKDVPQTPLPLNVHSRVSSNERPASATSLARQQEKERLRKRLLELENDESTDLDEAFEAAATQKSPDAAVSSTEVKEVVPELIVEERSVAASVPPLGNLDGVEQPQTSDFVPEAATEVEVETAPIMASLRSNPDLATYDGLEQDNSAQSGTPAVPEAPEVDALNVEGPIQESTATTVQRVMPASEERHGAVAGTAAIASPSEEGELSDRSMLKFYDGGGNGSPMNEGEAHADDPDTPEVDMDIDSDTSSEDGVDEGEAKTHETTFNPEDVLREAGPTQVANSDTDNRMDDLNGTPDSAPTQNAEAAGLPKQQADENEEVLPPSDPEHGDAMNWASENVDEFAYQSEDGEPLGAPSSHIGKDAADAASSDARTTESLAKSQSIDDDVSFERQSNDQGAVSLAAQVFGPLLATTGQPLITHPRNPPTICLATLHTKVLSRVSRISVGIRSTLKLSQAVTSP